MPSALPSSTAAEVISASPCKRLQLAVPAQCGVPGTSRYTRSRGRRRWRQQRRRQWRLDGGNTTHGRGGSDAISGCLAEGCILSRSAYYATIHSRYDTPCYDTPHATITCYATVHSRMAAATLAFARLCQLGSLRAERQLHSIEVWSLLASDMYIVAAQVSHLRRRTGRSAVYNL